MLQPMQPMGTPNQAATGPQAPKPGMPGMPQPGGQPKPQMPAGQMLSGVVGGGLGSILDSVGNAYAGNPQALEQKGVGGDLLAALAAQRLKSKMEAAQRELQMAAAGQQQGQPQKTVVEQNEDALMELTKQEMTREQAETMQQKQKQMQQGQQRLMQAAMQPAQPGIAGIPAPNAAEPRAMAAGGIVAFDDGGSVPFQDQDYEIDPRTGKVKYKGIWTDPELLRQSQKSEWNTARRPAGEAQRYKESTQGFLADLDKDFAAAKQAQDTARDAELEGKPGYDWKGKFYPVNEQGKVMVNGVPTDPRVLQGATQRTYTAARPAAPISAPAAGAQPEGRPSLPGERSVTATGVEGQRGAEGIARSAPRAVIPGGIAGPAGGSDAAFASRAARAAAETDPAKKAAEERAAAYEFMKPADEDVAARRQGLASLQQMTKERFDPGQMSNETLMRTLAGGAGRNWTTGAGMAQGYLGSKDLQYRQQRAAMMGEDKYLQDIMADIAAPKEKAVTAGTAAGTQAAGIKQQGIQSIANIANEQLRSAVQMAGVAAQNEANRLRQTEMSEAKAQIAYTNIKKEINDRIKDIETKFGKDVGLLAIREQAGSLDEAGKKTLAQKRNDMELAIEIMKQEWQPALDTAARKANIPVPASSPAPAGGGTVDKSNPLLAGK